MPGEGVVEILNVFRLVWELLLLLTLVEVGDDNEQEDSDDGGSIRRNSSICILSDEFEEWIEWVCFFCRRLRVFYERMEGNITVIFRLVGYS